MTFHFAYPNVKPRKGLFIGCGRYAVFPAGQEVDEAYEEVAGAPNTPNKTNLKRAVQLLAPESFASDRIIYHRQDKEEETYQGDSLDLAWLLAHVLRGRKLRCRFATDIWCTGVIQINNSPHLLDVDQAGFMLKLNGFLDPANSDEFFIIPLGNLNPEVRECCQSSQVDILCLNNGFDHDPCRGGKKRILAVPANGLPQLLDLLFAPTSVPARKSGKMPAMALLVCVLLAGLAIAGKPYLMPYLYEWGLLTREPPPPPSPPAPVFQPAQLRQALESGDFASLETFLKADLHNADKALRDFRARLLQPLAVGAELEYRKEDGSRGLAGFDLKNDDKLPVLSPRDYYRLHLRTEKPLDELYLYLFQVDSSGSLTPLVPNAEFGTKTPLRPWQWPMDVPGGDQWLFLDTLPGNAPSKAREFFYLLVSPWPARDIEELTRQLARQPDNESIKAKLLARILLRRQHNIPAVRCMLWSFFHKH